MKLSILEDIYLSYRFIVYRDSYNTFIISTSFSALISQPFQYHTCDPKCLFVDPLVTCQFVGRDLKMLAVWITKRCPKIVSCSWWFRNTPTHFIHYKNQFDCCLVEWWRTIYYIYYVYCINLNHNKEHHVRNMTKLPNVWGPVSGIWWSLPNLQVDTTASVSSFTELQALKICWGKKRRWVESPLKDLHIIKYTSRALCISASSAEPVHPKAATAWGMMWMRRCTRLAASANDGLSTVHDIEHIELQTWCCLHVSVNHRVEILVGTLKGS